MNTFKNTIVIRHRKENLKKCSLRGLEKRSDFHFFTYPLCEDPNVEGYILLTLSDQSIPLSTMDADKGLILLDATWRYALTMEKNIKFPEKILRRSLPSNWTTAYPRRQVDCSEPSRGLASIEAIYAAYSILGRPTTGLLDNYHWKLGFLEKNSEFLIE